MRPRLTAAALLAALSLGLTACGLNAPAERIVLPDALRTSTTTVDGKPFDAATLAGKPALLWFYAPSCETCATHALRISAWADVHMGQLHVVGVADPGPDGELSRFISSTGATNFPHLADKGHVLRDRFKVEQADTYVLIDKNDSVAFRGNGTELSTLGREIAKLAPAAGPGADE
ncbi:redoxin domain-containing protein [Streptomyces sp. NPDC014870]|uniref:redoxin domain-containing protein n=1 Tax=Streptomyces sp. NPDC014870 TaxID=3364925 RepID=UPI0036F5C9C7